MAPLDIPDGGLALLRPSDVGNISPDLPKNPPQVMRLNLAQSIINDLIDNLQDDQKARIRLGKHQSIHFGSHSQPFYSYPAGGRSELYIESPDGQDNLFFSGVLSHSLEVERAKEATAGTDEALVALEQQLSAFKQGKESKRTPMISSDQMRALRAGDNRTATGKEAASLARKSTSRADMEKERFFSNASALSSPISPALLSSRSPVIAPTSIPAPENKEKLKMDALRVPLTHLLAIRPVSVRFLALKTRASQEDCLALVSKFGSENRLDREKYDLRDKAYKELDIWGFPYPCDDDRQQAIDNAISAFDRMRISKQDKLWQMLLPVEERGKGKVLSRLNLRTGPPSKNVTPRIHAPAEEHTKEGYGTGNESENIPNTPDIDPVKSKASKAAPVPKKRPAVAPKRAPAKPKNTTITGRVTKSTDKPSDKRVISKTDAKFKSAEFVVDSDEDTEMADTNPSASPNNSSNSSSSQPSGRTSGLKSPALTPQSVKKVPSARPAGKTISIPPPSVRSTKDTSPRKPSPLGSSPPTNASDMDSSAKPASTTQSSNSSSPLINHHSRQRPGSGSAKPAAAQTKPRPKLQPSSAPLKRKAPADEPAVRSSTKITPIGLGISHGDTRLPQAKRRRPSSPSSGGSTSGNSSPSTSVSILRQRLQEKASLFRKYYAKYRKLHEELSDHPYPPEAQLHKLRQQHIRLETMKREIWDEDRQLRSR